jgi:hypothetical protein
MRALPIPDGVAETMGGRRVTIGDSDPTRDDVRPCDYVVTASTSFPGAPTYSACVALDDDERQALAAGAQLWLHLEVAEVPWSLQVGPAPDEEAPT